MRNIVFSLVTVFLFLIPQAEAGSGVTVFIGNGTDQTKAVTTLLSKDGSYLFHGKVKTKSISISGKNLTIDFAPDAVLEPAARVDILWQFENSDVVLKNFNVDGQGLAQTAYRDNGGTLTAGNIQMTNMGYADQKATTGVFGVFLNGTKSANITSAVFSNFHGIGNGIYGDSIGEVRGMYAQNTSLINVGTFSMSGGDGKEDNDYFHSGIGNAGGVIDNFVARYNGNTRRVFKIQSGHWRLQNVDVREGADFVPDSSQTQVGTHNLNAIDYAASSPGSIDVVGGYIDCSGFAACISDSGGGGQVTTESGLTMQGSTLKNIRDDAGTGGARNQDTVGFYSAATDTGSGMNGTMVINFGIGAYLQGEQAFSKNVNYSNPVDMAAVVGSSTVVDGLTFSGNQIVTKTPGYLNSYRIVEVYSGQNVRLTGNTLTEEGNITHAKRFIDCVGPDTTGVATGNVAPAGTTAMTAGSCSLTAHLP